MKKTLSWISMILVIALCAGLFAGCGSSKPAAPKEFTVKFDLNGGKLVSGSDVQTVTEGGSAKLPEVVREGYELTWDGEWENVTSDRTVTAQWEQVIPEYTVEFDLNGGTLVSGELTQTVLEGQDAEPPKAENGRSELDWGDDWRNITADTTVTARWIKVAMDTADLAEYVQERAVTVNVETLSGGSSTGSGFFIDDEGTIVTNFHVIDMATSISVEAGTGASYAVQEIVDFSNIYDLAILKIDMKDSPYLEFAEETPRTGESVYAVGSALGVLTGTFTSGVVSNVNRTYGLINCLQMDAAISSGNSGGPLVNAYGEVVGINTASYVNGENLNLAIKPETLDHLTMDKHWSVSRFTEWYEQESSRSWSPAVRGSNGATQYYLYSLVNNYHTVTGAKCLYSHDYGSDGAVAEGYYDMYDYYIYEYNTAQYDQYTEYIRSIGFEYQGSEHQSNWIGTSYYFYNEHDNILLDLFVYDDHTAMNIYPTYE